MSGPKFIEKSKQFYGGEFAENPLEKMYHLFQGYKLAADDLASISENTPHLKKKYIYPICFLYRHYIECHIKFIFIENGEIFGKEKFLVGHTLKNLLKELISLLVSIDNNFGTRPDDKKFIAMIEEFSNFDPLSTVFRYAYDLKGQGIRQDEFEIDIEKLKNKMDYLSNALYAIHAFIDHHIELKNMY